MILTLRSLSVFVTVVTNFQNQSVATSDLRSLKTGGYPLSGTYEELEAWRASMELALQVYRPTALFPGEEKYGLTSQMRLAAVSVPSNVAEGKGRPSDQELVQFLCHSRESLFEIETQLTIVKQLGYATAERCEDLRRRNARVGQMLNGFIRSIRPPAAVRGARVVPGA